MNINRWQKYKHVYVHILFITTNICRCILIEEERLYRKYMNVTSKEEL